MISKMEQGEERNIVHDFNTENKLMLLLGGFFIYEKYSLSKSMNILLIAVVLATYVFLFVMGVFTVASVSQDKVVTVKVVHILCVLVCVCVMPAARYRTRNKLRAAANLLSTGLYGYGPEQDEKYYQIKKNRVNQLREVNKFFLKICFLSALLNTLLLPLKNLLSKQETTDNVINPFLPLPIYMPFDTRPPANFLAALLANVTYNFFGFFTTTFSIMSTYASCAMQLIAQLDILIDSLSNIEERARAKFLKKYSFPPGEPVSYYELEEFQKCLCACLKENLIHHHAILRYTKATMPYMEVLNFLVVAFFSIMLAASIVAMVENSSIDMEVIGPLVMETCCVFLMCSLGQVIQEKKSQISMFLYATPWPDSNSKFKSILRTMSMNTYSTIFLKTPGFNVNMSLAAFGEIMSAGYKLTTLLR